MKKVIIIAAIVLIVILACWAAAIAIDASKAADMKMPVFAKAEQTADDGGSGIYRGLGYTVNVATHMDAEYGMCIDSVEMYLFGRFIAGAIADVGGTEPTFNATVVEIFDKTVVVEAFEGDDIRRSSDRISFSTGVLEDIGVRIGDKVIITYTGLISETYPAQIEAIRWQKIK